MHTFQETGGLFSGIQLFSSQQNGTEATLVPPPPPPPPPPSTTDNDEEYLQQLRLLNQSVRDWIDKHVKENPFIDLTPIFRDYDTHLKTLGR